MPVTASRVASQAFQFRINILIGFAEYIDKSTGAFGILARKKGVGSARRMLTSSSSDPVHVVLRGLREIKVYDVLNAVNIEATGSHISCHQNVSSSAAEVIQHAIAVNLRLVTMYGSDANPKGIDEAGQFVDLLLGGNKDDNLSGCARLVIDVREQLLQLGSLLVLHTHFHVLPYVVVGRQFQ